MWRATGPRIGGPQHTSERLVVHRRRQPRKPADQPLERTAPALDSDAPLAAAAAERARMQGEMKRQEEQQAEMMAMMKQQQEQILYQVWILDYLKYHHMRRKGVRSARVM